MPDESKQVFYAVCGHCFHHDNDARIEFNFRDQCIYSMCAVCKKMNKMSIKVDIPKPYPHSRTGLGKNV